MCVEPGFTKMAAFLDLTYLISYLNDLSDTRHTWSSVLRFAAGVFRCLGFVILAFVSCHFFLFILCLLWPVLSEA